MIGPQINKSFSTKLAVQVDFRLDFTPTASVCQRMKQDTRDYIQKQFADLTGLLEDAAELAVAGQSSKATQSTLGKLLSDLRTQLATCNDVL